MPVMPSILNLSNLVGAAAQTDANRPTRADAEPDVQFQSVLAMFLQTLHAPAQTSPSPESAEKEVAFSTEAIAQDSQVASTDAAGTVLCSLDETVARIRARALEAPAGDAAGVLVGDVEIAQQDATGTGKPPVARGLDLPPQAQAPSHANEHSAVARLTIGSDQPAGLPADETDAVVENALPPTSETDEGVAAETPVMPVGDSLPPTADTPAVPVDATARNWGQFLNTQMDAVREQKMSFIGKARNSGSFTESLPQNYGQFVVSQMQANREQKVDLVGKTRITEGLASVDGTGSTEQPTAPGSEPLVADAPIPDAQAHAVASSNDVPELSNEPDALASSEVASAAVPSASSSVNPVPTVPSTGETMQVAAPAGHSDAAFKPVSGSSADSANPQPAHPVLRSLLQAVPELVEQLRARVVTRPAVQQATLRLDPPSMGHLEISIHIDAQNQVRAVVAAQDPSTAQQLNAHADQLRNALSESGIRFEQFNFAQQSSRGDQGSGFGQATANDGREFAQEQTSGFESQAADADESEEQITSPMANGREVNLRV